MKAILKAFGAVALAGAMVLPVLAQTATTTTNTDAKDLKKVVEDQGINYVETAQKGITLSGYVDVSYTNQFGGRGTAFTNQQAYLHEFDVNNDSFNLNAVKIALEKALPSQNVWAAGFRVDTMFGQDANILSQSDPVLSFNKGNNYSGEGDYASNTIGSGVYIEQALVKVNIPVGNGLQIYFGKFVTLLGYEVIESPANPNFSRGLLFTNAIPLTNTGIYADYKFNSTFEAKLGIVDGWNQSDSTPNQFTTYGNGRADAADDYPFGGKALTGQLVINAPGGNANITQSFIYSPSGETDNNTFNNTGAGSFPYEAADNGPVAVYDIWGNWNPTFVKDSALTLGFNVDFGYNGASGYPASYQNVPSGGEGPTDLGTGHGDSNTWYGVALYTQYKVSKLLTLAARGEYLHEDPSDYAKFGVDDVSNDDFSETLTASFNIWDNLLTRVEYRYDHLTEGYIYNEHGNNIATYGNQDEVSVEAVYSF
ncbi:MAG: porin [Methylacidiphilales bacterium]|nr:porin [Candidatus Methylacidiphilales bacterium]